MTVRRILDAAAEILEERGYEGVSTNRIAAAAEISPGSLYQYFPNKDAILDALGREYTQQLLDRMSRNIREWVKHEPAALISMAVRAQIDAMLEQPEALRMVCLRMGGSCADVLKPLEVLIADIIRGYTIALPKPPVDVDVDAATWIIVQLLGTTIPFVLDRPPIAKDAFVSELTRLALGHPIVKALTRCESDHLHDKCLARPIPECAS